MGVMTTEDHNLDYLRGKVQDACKSATDLVLESERGHWSAEFEEKLEEALQLLLKVRSLIK